MASNEFIWDKNAAFCLECLPRSLMVVAPFPLHCSVTVLRDLWALDNSCKRSLSVESTTLRGYNLEGMIAYAWVLCPQCVPSQFKCWSPNSQHGCIWKKEVIKIKWSPKGGDRDSRELSRCLHALEKWLEHTGWHCSSQEEYCRLQPA